MPDYCCQHLEVQVIAPGNPTGSSTVYHWSAVGTGIVGTSRTPLLCAARKLLAAGVDPATPISLVWGDSDTVSITTTVGTAAGLTVAETSGGPRFHKYVEFDRTSLPSAEAIVCLLEQLHTFEGLCCPGPKAV